MLKLPFHQTTAEQMVRVAATLLFHVLLRAGYPLVRLSDLTEKPQYGFTASATDQPIGPKFVRITDLKDGKIDWETVPYCECTQIDNYRLSQGDILFARTGATTGKTHLISNTGTNEAVFASYLIRIRPKADVISPEYLYSFFQSNIYWSQILEEKQGSAQPNVNGQRLLTLHLPIIPANIQLAISTFLAAVRNRQNGSNEELPELPHLLDEQRRIVARIEALAGRVAEAQRLRAEAMAQVERMVASESHRLFARLFTEDEVTTIGQVVTFRGDLLRPTDGKTGLQRFVGLQHVESHTGEKIGEDWVLAEDLQGRKFRFSAGEIVYGYLRPYLNKVWIADGEGLCSVDQYILRPDPTLIDTHYLAYFMRSPHFLQRANELTHNLMLPRLRSGLLASIEIPVPSLAKQQEVVLLLDKLHAKGQMLKNLQSATQTELDALLPAILDKAFRGEVE